MVSVGRRRWWWWLEVVLVMVVVVGGFCFGNYYSCSGGRWLVVRDCGRWRWCR